MERAQSTEPSHDAATLNSQSNPNLQIILAAGSCEGLSNCQRSFRYNQWIDESSRKIAAWRLVRSRYISAALQSDHTGTAPSSWLEVRLSTNSKQSEPEAAELRAAAARISGRPYDGHSRGYRAHENNNNNDDNNNNYLPEGCKRDANECAPCAPIESDRAWVDLAQSATDRTEPNRIDEWV